MRKDIKTVFKSGARASPTEGIPHSHIAHSTQHKQYAQFLVAIIRSGF